MPPSCHSSRCPHANLLSNPSPSFGVCKVRLRILHPSHRTEVRTKRRPRGFPSCGSTPPAPGAATVTSQAVARLHAEHRQGAGPGAVTLPEATTEDVLDLRQVLQLPVGSRLCARLLHGGRGRRARQLGASGGHGVGAAAGTGAAVGKAAKPLLSTSLPAGTAVGKAAKPLRGFFFLPRLRRLRLFLLGDVGSAGSPRGPRLSASRERAEPPAGRAWERATLQDPT